MSKYNWVAGGVILGFVGISLALFSSFEGLGTRKIESIYSFKYKGSPATLNRADVRWGPDHYYFSIGADKLVGRLVTDDGKEINITSSRRKENSGYFIRDSQAKQ